MFLEDKKLNPGVTVEADPFSLDALIAWLEKQPGETEYDYRDTDNKHGGCLFSRYAVFLGYSADFDGYADMIGAWGTFPGDPFEESRLAVSEPHTLGAALQRARALRGAR
jgi:hypothetical protein